MILFLIYGGCGYKFIVRRAVLDLLQDSFVEYIYGLQRYKGNYNEIFQRIG